MPPTKTPTEFYFRSDWCKKDKRGEEKVREGEIEKLRKGKRWEEMGRNF